MKEAELRVIVSLKWEAFHVLEPIADYLLPPKQAVNPLPFVSSSLQALHLET